MAFAASRGSHSSYETPPLASIASVMFSTLRRSPPWSKPWTSRRAWVWASGRTAGRLVGLHTPEFAAEKDVGRIKERMAKNKLTFAVAVDNNTKTWEAWGNRYWPCVYLVDKAGNVRHRFEGELGDDGVKKATKLIDGLLAEPAPGAK